ncbi:MAG TPA: hypothetical protein VNF71_00750 [Acidimicrobiales bacterium]|nr:hypothetical protein [Acidimicrobiales bacterium]
MTLPRQIAHADWGTDPKKRQVAVAELASASGYRVVSVAPADSVAVLNGDLRKALHASGENGGLVLAGFDFPIGLPGPYADRTGITSFLDFLPEIGHGAWERFGDVATRVEEIALHRPFYPAKPGGTKQNHLFDRLGMTRQELRRRCEGNDAEMLFWTLGGKQVGKAALSGWRLLAAARYGAVRFWPFDGPLASLLSDGADGVVVAETYPAEFYRHFRSGPTGRGSKRKQEDRLRWIPDLLSWASTLSVAWEPEVLARVRAGFSAGGNGEDEFDAVVGLVGMIAVVTGALPSGEPSEDPAVASVEGWILGRELDPAAPTDGGAATTAAGLNREEVALLVKLAGDVHGEATRCADAKCWRAALLLMGSTLEAVLLATVRCFEQELRQRGHWSNQRKPLHRWTLEDLLDTARRARWLPMAAMGPKDGNDLFESLDGEVGDAVKFVQAVRNMTAHPGRYVTEEVRPDFDNDEEMRITYEVIEGITRSAFERLHGVVESSAPPEP